MGVFKVLVLGLLTFIKAPRFGDRHTSAMVFRVAARSMARRQPEQQDFCLSVGVGGARMRTLFFCRDFYL